MPDFTNGRTPAGTTYRGCRICRRDAVRKHAAKRRRALAGAA